MEKFMSKNIFKVLAFVLLICLCFLTGCSGDVQEGKGEAFIRFDGQQGSARALSQFHESQYKIEDMYWTYVAVKTDGLYTEGESVEADSTHVNPGLGSSGYVERPVKSGPATGLDADVGPFATGDWKITLYGYVNCVVESGVVKFKNLIYKSAETDVKVIKLTSSTTVPVVPFVIDYVTPAPTKGIFKLNPMFITVPEYTQFFDKTTATASELTVTDSVLEVDLYDVTGTRSLIAKYVKTLDSDLKAGDIVPVVLEFESPDDPSVKNVKSFEIGSTPALKKFEVVARYKDRYTVWASDNVEAPTGSGYATKLYNYSGDDNTRYGKGYAPVGKIVTYNIQFKAGEIVTLSGDVNDVADLYPETEPKGEFGVAVAKILKSGATSGSTDPKDYDYYSSIPEAVAGLPAAGGKIEIINKVERGGVVSWAGSGNVTLNLNGYRLADFTFISSSSKQCVLQLEASNSITMNSGAYLSSLRYSSTGKKAMLDTNGGKWVIDAVGYDVWHTGSVDECELKNSLNTRASNLGYHVLCEVKTKLTLGSSAKGFVSLGAGVSIRELSVNNSCSSANVVLCGTQTTQVGNITSIRDSGSSTVFAKFVLHGVNKTTEDTKTLYGIEGMKLVLPDFYTSGTSGAPLFVKDGYVFDSWNRASGGTGVVVTNGASIVTPAASSTVNNLYATWRELLKIGGKIFYVNPFSNGAVYTFYDNTGKEIESWEIGGASYLNSRNATYYEKSGSATKDKFYVYNSGLKNIGNNLYMQGTAGGDVDKPLSYTRNGKTYSVECYNVRTGRNTWVPMSDVGLGRENTAYYLNMNGTATTGAERYLNPAYYVNDTNTVWNYLREKVNKSGGINSTGLYDWYVPSAAELWKLFHFDDSVCDVTYNVIGSSTLASLPEWGSPTPTFVGSCMADMHGYDSWLVWGAQGTSNKCSWWFIRSF